MTADQEYFWKRDADFVRRARKAGFGRLLDKASAEEAMVAAGYAKLVEDDDGEPPVG